MQARVCAFQQLAAPRVKRIDLGRSENRALFGARGKRSVFVSAEVTAFDGRSKINDTVSSSVSVLNRAASTGAVPASDVFRALWQLEKEKLPEDAWGEKLGASPGGRRWKLVFTAGAKDVKEGQKTGAGGGFYFPLTAVQRWDAEKEEIENGIYLGQIAALTFSGPYEYQKKKLTFDFNSLKIRLGPVWLPIKIPSAKKDKAGPFFLFFYVDDQIACARGRGGGYAIWSRTTPEWELKAGVTL